MSDIEDLDILRPPKSIVRLNGKEIDCTIIPCAITFDVDAVSREMRELYKGHTAKQIQNNEFPEITKKLFDLTIKMCSIFVNHYYPEMDEQWFRENCNSAQIYAFSKRIQSALKYSYRGIEKQDSKN